MTTDLSDEREEELSSITAIFPELVISPDDPFKASLDLQVCPNEPLSVYFFDAVAGNAHETPKSEVTIQRPPDVRHLSHLPSLNLHIHLPIGYPSETPPAIHITTEHSWLPQTTVNRLVAEASSLWQEYGQSQILFAYIDFLQQDALACFGLEQPLPLAKELADALQGYDQQATRKKFEQGTYDCMVCLEPKKGSVCHEMRGCGHVFCHACLQDFYNAAITEGDVSSVKCLAPDCGLPANATAAQKRAHKQPNLQPRELLEVGIEKTQVQRYVEIKLKKLLESDQTVLYCPRKWCGAPARTPRYQALMLAAATLGDFPDETQSEAETKGSAVLPKAGSIPDRLTICSKCTFAFCSRCLASWHGDYYRCRPPASSDQSETDKASEDWIRTHTSPCPTCSAPAQKTMGCNHMRCFQCNTHFCYLCGAWLKPEDPYRHFNEKGRECYMKLWELEEGDEGDNANVAFGGARAAEIAHLEAVEAARLDLEAQAIAREEDET